MITLAALSGPVPKLGVVMAAALSGASILLTGRKQALAMIGGLVLAPALLLADIWSSPQLAVVHRHPLVAVGAVMLGLSALGGGAAALHRREALLAPLAVVALPFRIPISAGGTTSNLLVPLYLVVAAATLAACRPALWPRSAPRLPGTTTSPQPLSTPDAPRGSLGADAGVWLRRMLAIMIVLYALQSIYSPGFEKALQQMVFFYVPFSLLFCLLSRLSWSPRLLAICLRTVVALAVLFALVGFVEYATKKLFLNPRLIAANDVHAYFTVNSVFFDPDIFGRFLALVMILLASLLVFGREPRAQLIAVVLLAVLWAGLVLTLSRSSLGALLVGLGAMAAIRWPARRILVLSGVVVVLGTAAVAISPNTFGLNQGLNGASSGRANLVSGGVSMFGRRPVWGYGSGSFVTEYRAQHPAGGQTLSASHTIPVTIAAEQGLIGELAYLVLVAVALLALFRGARGDPKRVAVAVAFLALVFHTMLYADFLEDPMTWTLLGIGLALAARGAPAADAPPARSRESVLTP